MVTRNEPSSDSSDSDDSVVVIEDDDVSEWRNKKKGKLPVFGRRKVRFLRGIIRFDIVTAEKLKAVKYIHLVGMCLASIS